MARRAWLEADLLKLVLRRLGRRPDTRVYRQNAGKVPFINTSGEERWFDGGAPVGAADISGWTRPATITVGDRTVNVVGGQRVEIELKVPPKKRTIEQLAWAAAVEEAGCVYVYYLADRRMTLQENVDAAEREFERALAARLARGL